MYGDRQFTNMAVGNIWRGATKVYKIKGNPLIFDDDFIVGFAGTASDMVDISTYFQHPEMFKRPPRASCSGLVLTCNKEIFVFDDYTRWLRVDEPFAAIGSGSLYAIGAMASGKSPVEAVRIASKHDAYSGMGVKGYRFS